jgi:hypothetical protein
VTLSKSIKIGFGAVVALGLLVYFLLRTVHASYGYEVKCDFAVMPFSDVEVRRWLRSQPGVVEHTVFTLRTNRTLKVRFIMSQDLTGHPTFPGLDEQCQVLGYRAASVGFRDVVGAERGEGWYFDYDPQN